MNTIILNFDKRSIVFAVYVIKLLEFIIIITVSFVERELKILEIDSRK